MAVVCAPTRLVGDPRRMGLLRRRTDGDTRVVVSETVLINRPPAAVLGFLLDPASAVATGQSVTRAVRAPDTPAGEVGEQHLHFWTDDDGTLVVEVEEVVELDFPRRVATRSLTTPGDLRVVYACEPAEAGGTTYTQEVSITVTETSSRHLTRQLFVDETRRVVARIKEILESS